MVLRAPSGVAMKTVLLFEKKDFSGLGRCYLGGLQTGMLLVREERV